MNVNLFFDKKTYICSFYVDKIFFREKEELIKLLNKNAIKWSLNNSNNLNISFDLAYYKLTKKFQIPEIMVFFINNNAQFIGDKKLINQIMYYANLEKNKDAKIYNSFVKILDKKNILNLEYNFLTVKPYKFQIEQANAMYNYKRISNFSSPGSGKTITSMISVINEYLKNNINYIFIFGPKSARYTWTSKTQSFKQFINNDLKIHCYDTSINKFNKDILKGILHNDEKKLHLIFINFHKLQIDTGWYKLITKFFSKNIGVIVDECHYFKNIQSKKFEKLKNISKQAKFCYLLSGTPIPRSIDEAFYISNLLWPINNIRLINKKLPFNMDKKHYLSNFHKTFVRIDKNKNNVIKPLKIIIKKIDPNIVEKYIMEKIYEDLDSDLNELDISFQQKINKVKIIRLMQAASSPRSLNMPLKESIKEIYEQYDQEKNRLNDKTIEESESIFNFSDSSNDDKLIKSIIKSSNFKNILKKYNEKTDPRIIKLLDLLNKFNDVRIIIWNVFRKSTNEIVKLLKINFPQRLIEYIDGTIVDFDRENKIDSIRKSINGILIASPASIAESISLHKEIDYAIYFFRNYVGSHWMQSLDRIHRLVGVNNQSRNKFAYILMSNDPKYNLIDDLINKNLEKKTKLQKTLLNKNKKD